MNGATLLLSELSARLCLTLAHSLWQGALLAGVAWLVARCWPGLSVAASYRLHVAALLGALAVAPITLAVLTPAAPTDAASVRHAGPTAPGAGAPAAPRTDGIASGASPDTLATSAPHDPPEAPTVASPSTQLWAMLAPCLATAYALGVAAMLFRLTLGVRRAERLRALGRPIASGPLVEALDRLSRQWSMRAAPALVQVDRLIVPMVVGLIKPAILIPPSALLGLSPEQLQMVLAHELAHVKRYDMWIHLAQRLSEALLFFNPAVWLLSRRIDTLREYCCDALACRADEGAAGDTERVYAAALLRVVELGLPGACGGGGRGGHDLAAIAASGRSPSELRRRVARLFGEPLREPVGITRGGLAAFVALAALVLSGPLVWTAAAAPQPGDKPPRVEAENNTILTARVVDAETGEPIDAFTALAGVSPIEGLGWQWQPHTAQACSDGELRWPPRGKQGYQKQVLRIEAEGYAPYQSPLLIRLDEGEYPLVAGAHTGPDGETIPNVLSARPGDPVKYTMRLHRDPGVRGRVLLPTGAPAAGATVAIGMANDQRLVIRDGNVAPQPRDNSRIWPTGDRVVTTDGDGRFTLPTESQPAAVVVTHPRGVIITSYANFVDSPEITLKAWGRVEGRVELGGEPREGVEVSLSASGGNASKQFNPIYSVTASQSATSDASGRFEFTLVPPGRAQLSGEGVWPMQQIDVLADGPTDVVLGGRGRPVIGRLVGRDNWDNVRIRFAPNAPRPGDMGTEHDPWPAYLAFLNSDAGKNYARGNLPVAADGSFRIDDVPPADYQIFVEHVDADGNRNVIAGDTFTIDTLPGGKSDEPLDLGRIGVAPAPAAPPRENRAGEKPSLTVRTLSPDGEPVSEAYVTLWRALGEDEAEPVNTVNGPTGFGYYNPVVWEDAEHNARWVRAGSTQPRGGRPRPDADSFRFDDLPPGRYRVSAVPYQNSDTPDPTPYGVSDPLVIVAGQQPSIDVTLRRGTAPLTLRVIDAQSRAPIQHLAVRLRDTHGLPIVHGHGSGNFFEWTSDQGEMRYARLEPGEYSVQVLGKLASENQFVQYEPLQDWLPVTVEQAGNTIEIAVEPRALAPNEIDKRFPFSIFGRVTDAGGNPLAGVTVRAATGVGTLMGGGSVQTNDEGRYRLYFGRGVQGPEVQAAQFYAKKPGWKLDASEGHLSFLMTEQSRDAFAEMLKQNDGQYWGKRSADEVVFPHEPREIDFTMTRQ